MLAVLELFRLERGGFLLDDMRCKIEHIPGDLHVLDVVERLCDRVIILNKGHIVADDTPTALMAAAHRGTLETVFRSLTSDENQEQTAKEFVDVVRSRGAQK